MTEMTHLAARRLCSGARPPMPPFDGEQLSREGHSESTAESTVDSLFAVGLKITAARAIVDGEAGVRLDQALEDLDTMIVDLRSRTG